MTYNYAEKKTRKSYTCKFKLGVLKDYDTPNTDGTAKSKTAIAAKYNITQKMLRTWISDKNLYLKVLKTSSMSICHIRKVNNNEIQIPFKDIDNALSQWINNMNSKGLVVKEKYLKAKAINISKEMGLINFKCSNGYINNFKKRHGIVSRIHTTCRAIPENSKILARDFIESTRALIKNKNIKLKNILNLDQIPRYFEQENSRTLTKKGIKNIKIIKAGSSHARFTYTPLISADGKLISSHCLFSKLKKIPKDLNISVNVDVNETGMWSEGLVLTYFEKYILNRHETLFLREPVLVILDSFAAHLKIDKKFEKYNIFISYVPPGMTPFLQMIDVSISRSFQQFYADEINKWISEEISNVENRTKLGHIKRPTYKQITNICDNFAKSISTEMISNSFLKCGITDNDLDINKLHSPLKTLLLDEMFIDNTLESINNMILQEAEIHCSLDNWISISCTNNSLFEIISHLIYDNGSLYEDIKNEIIEKICDFKELVDIMDKDYLYNLRSDHFSCSELEIYAASKIFNLKINYYTNPDQKNPFYIYNNCPDNNAYVVFDLLFYHSKYYIRNN